jgi:hypothetical protein
MAKCLSQQKGIYGPINVVMAYKRKRKKIQQNFEVK